MKVLDWKNKNICLFSTFINDYTFLKLLSRLNDTVLQYFSEIRYFWSTMIILSIWFLVDFGEIIERGILPITQLSQCFHSKQGHSKPTLSSLPVEDTKQSVGPVDFHCFQRNVYNYIHAYRIRTLRCIYSWLYLYLKSF